jgi:anti-sigma regulatory factor (Ser/Thr protein kinase)
LTAVRSQAYEGDIFIGRRASGLQIQLSLAPTLSAPGITRERVAELRAAVPEETLNDLSLLCTEVVTNAVKYAGLSSDEMIQVDVNSYPSRIEVKVRYPDHNEFDPSLSVEDPDETSGWRLLLIDRLADRWRMVRTDGDVEVWLQIGLSSAIA